MQPDPARPYSDAEKEPDLAAFALLTQEEVPPLTGWHKVGIVVWIVAMVWTTTVLLGVYSLSALLREEAPGFLRRVNEFYQRVEFATAESSLITAVLVAAIAAWFSIPWRTWLIITAAFGFVSFGLIFPIAVFDEVAEFFGTGFIGVLLYAGATIGAIFGIMALVPYMLSFGLYRAVRWTIQKLKAP